MSIRFARRKADDHHEKKIHKNGVQYHFLFCIIPAAVRLPEKESISTAGLTEIPEHELVAGSGPAYATNSSFYGRCYTENGYYEIMDGLINFVSYDTGDRYIVCSRPNCKHKDGNCAAKAWYLGTLGLARYQNHMYIIKHNAPEYSYTLSSFDLDGENQKEIITLSCGDKKQDGWHMVDVSQVYYCSNVAWCDVRYEYIENGEFTDCCRQLVGYQLDTGEKIELTQIHKTGDGVDNPFSYKWISEDKIVIEDYNTKSIFIYDMSSRTMDTYTEQQMREALETLGEDLSDCPAADIRFIGYVKETGMYYFQVFGYSDSTNENTVRNIVFSWDLDSSGAILADFGGGGIIFQMVGYTQTMIVDDTDILYSVDLDNERGMIYRLDLISGESRQLFEDDTHITFRILYCGQDFYIGTLDEGDRLCRISKEDFDKGNLSAAETISKY